MLGDGCLDMTTIQVLACLGTTVCLRLTCVDAGGDNLVLVISVECVQHGNGKLGV